MLGRFSFTGSAFRMPDCPRCPWRIKVPYLAVDGAFRRAKTTGFSPLSTLSGRRDWICEQALGMMRRGQPADRFPFLYDTRDAPRILASQSIRFSAGTACDVSSVQPRKEIPARACDTNCCRFIAGSYHRCNRSFFFQTLYGSRTRS
jgi:hypothetical protein